jgi:phage terminase large subunit
MIRQALRKVGVYMYCLPTFRQAKLVIFDSITNDGRRFLDFIPRELIKSTNSQELKVVLTNGSIIQFIGSDSYDTSLVGTNPRMVIMSEYALADPRAYHYIRPILNANGGTMMILSTPRGKNHLWDLYNIAF